MQALGSDAAALSGARFVRQLEPGAQHVPLTEGAAAGGTLLSCVGRSEEQRRNRTAFPGALPASVLASRFDAQRAPHSQPSSERKEKCSVSVTMM